jgi:hypothetical protein
MFLLVLQEQFDSVVCFGQSQILVNVSEHAQLFGMVPPIAVVIAVFYQQCYVGQCL